jgi:methionyl-tRNA formyltransferase
MTEQSSTPESGAGYGVVIATGFIKQLDALLSSLGDSSHFCQAVVTREGANDIVARAKQLGLPVFVLPNCLSLEREMQHNPKSREVVLNAVAELQALRPQVFVTWGFQIVPQCLINVASELAANFHFSDLPNYRGGMSLQAQIIEGEPFTRLSLHELTLEVDGGAILAQSAPIDLSGQTSQQVLAKGVEVAGRMLVDTLQQARAGTLVRRENKSRSKDIPHSWGIKHRVVSAANGSSMKVNDGYLGFLAIDWMLDSCVHIERACRAFDSFGGAFTSREKLLVHVLAAEQLNQNVAAQPGEVLQVPDEKHIVVQAKDGQLACTVRLNHRFSEDKNLLLRSGDRLSRAIGVSQLTGIPDADRQAS